ncbi:hypothetical protein [Chlamydia sp. 17-3921]|uniref:hypothetical protein n=1 Tax=Chlamydia sp. 17-3921 TaxID=2675798 RepID=UPI001F36CD81|nr:hypothetical protein [Chlamydia sp. 17-3921]
MTRKLENLSLIFKERIYRTLHRVHEQKKKVESLSQDLKITTERISLLAEKRQDFFFSRSSVVDYDYLLELLKTLQTSLYKQHSESLQFLLKDSAQLSDLINRRKIIEKIKNNKYSKIKR